MSYEISLRSLKQIIRTTRFSTRGDANEQKYWLLFKERFPNCELFWQNSIIPGSKWVKIKPGESGEGGNRDDVSADLLNIWYRHYSLFMQLCYAAWHLNLPAPSSFENFYTHLGSACDLAEDLLVQVYLLVLDCKGEQTPVLQGLSKEEFLEHAGKWYDKNYIKIYENYHSKGKGSPLHLPARHDIIREYFDDNKSWLMYKSFSRSIREYRNVVVHDQLIGAVQTQLGSRLVPKKERIQNYRNFPSIVKAAANPKKIDADFILEQEQMVLDFGRLQTLFNELWSKPIKDLGTLLLKERNAKLLTKYNLAIPARPAATSKNKGAEAELK